MHSIQRPALPRPEHAFDAIPAAIQARRDIGSGPKRLYGALSSAQRMDTAPTYAEYAAWLGTGVRCIVRWVQQLAAAGLIEVRRRGQGLSNVMTVLGLVVRSAAAATPRVPSWPAASSWSGARNNPGKKFPDRQTVYRPPAPSAYLETRRGTLARR